VSINVFKFAFDPQNSKGNTRTITALMKEAAEANEHELDKRCWYSTSESVGFSFTEEIGVCTV
jgi:hypothetical protein